MAIRIPPGVIRLDHPAHRSISNGPPGAFQPVSMVIVRSGENNLNIVMPFNSATGIYDIHVGQLRVRWQRKWLPKCSASDNITGNPAGPWIDLSVNTTIPTSIGVITLKRYERTALSITLCSSCACISPTDSPMGSIPRI